MLEIENHDRVRVITLNRPEVLNAFDTAMYDATARALADAAAAPDTAVVVITGAGRAFSAGQDLGEMANIADAATSEDGDAVSGFPGFVDALVDFPKPLIVAVNGLGLGIGATILGHADLSFIAEDARLKCPFTSLGVAPEAAASLLFPAMLGWQDAAWVLLSSEWIDAPTAVEIGLVRTLCPPEDLMEEALAAAHTIARHPISSLVAVKSTMTEARRALVADARVREDAQFQRLLGGPANTEALTAFLERRDPDFSAIDGE